MVEGQNQNSRADKISEFQGGEIYLLDTPIGDGDGDTELQANFNDSQTTADADWSTTVDNTTGTTVLETATEIEFPNASGYTIQQIVVQSTSTPDNLIIDDSPTGDTDLSGDGTLSIPAGNISYTFGGE